MKKTYEGIHWPEVMDKVDNARALGLLSAAVLAPASEQDGFDWDLTLAFAGFDAEPSFAGRRIIAFDLAEPGGGVPVGLEIRDGVARPVELPQGAEQEREAVEVPPVKVREEEPAPEAAPAPEEIPEPEIVKPATTKPGPPAEPKDQEGTRLCTKCGPTEGPKPISEFAPNGNAKDGLSKICRPCRSEQARSASRTRHDRKAAPDGPDAGTREAGERPGPSGEAEGNADDSEPAWGTWRPEPLPPEDKTPVSATLQDPKVTVLPSGGRVPELENLATNPGPRPEKEEKPERFCANGEDCMSVPHTGRPTKLNDGNKGDTCYGCEERATGRFGMGA